MFQWQHRWVRAFLRVPTLRTCRVLQAQPDISPFPVVYGAGILARLPVTPCHCSDSSLQALLMLSTHIFAVVSDLEKRKNPVCHFVTPLDGSVDVDEHRRPEVCDTLGTAQ